MKRVTFKNRDIDVVGDIYLPPNFDEDKAYTTVVLTIWPGWPIEIRNSSRRPGEGISCPRRRRARSSDRPKPVVPGDMFTPYLHIDTLKVKSRNFH